jgi:hypothetical protein
MKDVTISKLNEYGVSFNNGLLKFRIVPGKVFPQHRPPIWEGGGPYAAYGNSQCCPNPGYCISCGSCGSVCFNG